MGIKIWNDCEAKPGAIIIRQRGRKWYAGENVGMGKDHTLFSKVHGAVHFTRLGDDPTKVVKKNKRKKSVVNVIEYDFADTATASL